MTLKDWNNRIKLLKLARASEKRFKGKRVAYKQGIKKTGKVISIQIGKLVSEKNKKVLAIIRNDDGIHTNYIDVKKIRVIKK